jgi:hypothetical protein
MEDHEIRSRHPIAEPILSFREKGSPNSILYLRMALRNTGAMRAKDIKVVLAIPHGLFTSKTPECHQESKLIEGHLCDTSTFQKTELIIFPDDESPVYGSLTSTARYLPIEMTLSNVFYVRSRLRSKRSLRLNDVPPYCRRNCLLPKLALNSIITRIASYLGAFYSTPPITIPAFLLNWRYG